MCRPNRTHYKGIQLVPDLYILGASSYTHIYIYMHIYIYIFVDQRKHNNYHIYSMANTWTPQTFIPCFPSRFLEIEKIFYTIYVKSILDFVFWISRSYKDSLCFSLMHNIMAANRWPVCTYICLLTSRIVIYIYIYILL